MNYEHMMSLPPRTAVVDYDARDTMLYALGVGVGARAPVDARELRFAYEDGLQALPTFAVVLGAPGFWLKEPELEIDWRRVLHGEQRLTLHHPLPPYGRVRSILTIEAIYDKGAGKGALMHHVRKLYDDPTNTLLATVGSTSFMRGDGGCGGRTDPPPRPHTTPADREPDIRVDIPTAADLALLYRLSGDFNPLHVDPVVAQEAGFDRPILHGLCSYGVAGRAILAALCEDDPARLSRLDVRFSSPVFPGETLRVEIWRDGEGAASFRTRVVERDLVVLNNGRIEFKTT